MDLDFVWRLPQSYLSPEISSKISADAQIYLRCLHCPSEARLDVSFALAASFKDAKCRTCGQNGMAAVRHLEKRLYSCRDCQKVFTALTARFISDRCPVCDSNQLTVLSYTVEPRFPGRFNELVAAKENQWGVSASEDAQYIVRSSQALNFLPDFPLHLLTDILFVERLIASGGYNKTHERLHLLNLEGNLYRDYFRRTGEIAAGIKAIPIFEKCAREETDRVNRALMEHNVAMAIYSLLSKYDEEVVSTLSS